MVQDQEFSNRHHHHPVEWQAKSEVNGLACSIANCSKSTGSTVQALYLVLVWAIGCSNISMSGAVHEGSATFCALAETLTFHIYQVHILLADYCLMFLIKIAAAT